jgi:phosphoglycolate phosphatase
MIGDGARMLVRRALPPDASVDEVLSSFQRAYAATPCVHTRLLPGARELFALGVPLAVVTNKPRSVALLVLERLGIADAFGTVWAGGDGPLKPAPDGFRRAAADLGVAPSRAWAVGDGPQDVLAGRAAGCFTIAVPGIAEARVLADAKPDLLVPSLVEVARLVRQARVTSGA